MFAVLLLNRMNTKRRISKTKQASSSENTISEEAGNIHCRTCLSKEDLVAIFYCKETEEKRAEELYLVTGLNIRLNDGLSQKICVNCVETIHTVLQFRKSCKKTEKALLKMIDNKPGNNKLKETESTDLSVTFDSKFSMKSPFGDSTVVSEYDAITNWSHSLKYEDDNFDYDVDITYEDDYEDVKDNINIKKRNSPLKQKPGRKVKKQVSTSPYKCTICNKEFRMKATYNAHTRFHTNFCVCESCGKRCRNNNQLQEHKRAKHGLGRIHKCAYCEYTSATKEALTIHERRHTGERPYICDHCGATFHRRSNLVQHIAIHLPDKNFQCDMCPKRLKSKKFLQIHRHNAHTGRRYGYVCAICEHVFEKPNKVRAHVRRVHAVPDHDQPAVRRIQL